MEIQVIEQDATHIKFTLHGVGNTFCNNLKKALYTDKNTEAAAYKIDHPLLGTPNFFIEKGKTGTFSDIMQTAVKAIKKDNSTFLAAFKKA